MTDQIKVVAAPSEKAVYIYAGSQTATLSFIAAGESVQLIMEQGKAVPQHHADFYVIMRSGSPINVLTRQQVLESIGEGFGNLQVVWQYPER